MNYRNNSYNYKSLAALTDEDLMKKAPSVFATQPWQGMSARYAFIPTSQVVAKMRDEGFAPVQAVQSRCRIEGKGDFTKHMIRFRPISGELAKMEVGSTVPELCLTNAHDGMSAYVLWAGAFRKVCQNGLMVSDKEYGTQRVRHSGDVSGVIEASFQIVEEFPKMMAEIETFNTQRLLPEAREIFGRAALELRYEDDEVKAVTVAQVLQTVRTDDVSPTLYNTFNTVQEHLINGGVRYRNENRRRMKTRPVTGIAENTKLNRALWTLTSEMSKLLGHAA